MAMRYRAWGKGKGISVPSGGVARRIRKCLFLALIVLALGTGTAQAAIWTVDRTTDDPSDGSGASGSLRWAVAQAASSDTIRFADSLAGQTIASTLSWGDAGSKYLTFQGPASGTVTISKAGEGFILHGGSLGANIRFENMGSADSDSDTVIANRSLVEIASDFYNNTVSIITNHALSPYGGGLMVRDNITGEVSGTFQNNKINSTNNAFGGGLYTSGSITGGITGTLNENQVLSTLNEAFGGGVMVSETLDRFAGRVTGNLAQVQSQGWAHAQGGGIWAQSLTTIVGSGSGDTATGRILRNKAYAENATGTAVALGGGIYLDKPVTALTISNASINLNTAEAKGSVARAEGGAIFVNTTQSASLPQIIIDNASGQTTNINFNTVVVNDEAKASGIHFGRENLSQNSQTGASLTVQGAGNVYMMDPVTVDLNNGKSFTLTKTGNGGFNWGGTNVLDAAGGSTVTLGTGAQFYSGFSMDNGGTNATGNVVMNLDGGGAYYQVAALNTTAVPGDIISFSNTTINLNNSSSLQPYGILALGDNAVVNIGTGSAISLGGEATLKVTGNSRINSGGLSIGAGETLAVDLGKTLTLDSAATLTLNGGTLSIGVDAGNASGKIVSQNTTTAPTFNGVNTMDIATWIPGSYTVLEAGATMNTGAPGTFATFTIGGNALGAGMSLTPTLSGDNKSLILTAALNQDSAQKTWGGTAGTWNYVNTNWLPGSSQFVLGDLALFDGTGAASGLAVTVGGTSVETAGMSITGGSYTFSGGKITGRTDISQGSLTPTGQLYIAGQTGDIVFTNSLDFQEGLRLTGDMVYGSQVNVTLSDYTGGRVWIETPNASVKYAGKFSAKVAISGLSHTDAATLKGGAMYIVNAGASTVDILGGSVIDGNTLTVSGSDPGYAEAMGGGIYTDNMGTMAGGVSGNKATATNTNGPAYAEGGGLYVTERLNELSGLVNDNEAKAVSSGGTGEVQATGGGVLVPGAFSDYGLKLLSGTIENNRAEATGGTGDARNMASGGGVKGYIQTVTGNVQDNLARAEASGSRKAWAMGGGFNTFNTTELSGNVTGNSAEASGGALAYAYGGGGYLQYMSGVSGSTISGGTYSNNQAAATGGASNTARGGGLFIDSYMPYGEVAELTLRLDPKKAAITFENNSVNENGTVSSNGLHFGRSPKSWENGFTDSTSNMVLSISDSVATSNLITIADGITTDINNGKTFTISQTGGAFLWGGPNLFDSAGGDTVNLTGGTTRLMNGFSLNRGSTNGGTGLLPFNVTGGHLKSEGAATSLSNTALSVSGGKLTVDLGSTLTLDTASTFSLNNGVLSFGIGAGNASGKIVSQNTTTAPTFNGVNTMDIATWIPGSYTVLEAGAAMNTGAPGTFATFTIGGNALGVGMSLTPTLSGDNKSLILTAALNQDSAQKTWGGASGTWNYVNTNWLPGSSQFVLGDLALFDGTGAASGLAVTVGGTSVETAGMSITGGSYTFSGGKILGRTDISQGSLTPTGRLDITGNGNITFNNAANFVNGVIVAANSEANISFADYSGGRVLLGANMNAYKGTFSGLLNIQNQSQIGTTGAYGGALRAWNSRAMSIADGSLLKGNTVEANVVSGSSFAYAHGGGADVNDLATLAGTLDGNTAKAGHSDSGNASASGGGIYTGNISTLSGTLSNNTARGVSSGSGDAYGIGGGVYTSWSDISTLSGILSGNTAEAINTGTGNARAAGGGGEVDGTIGILSGTVSGNMAKASSESGRATAAGGGLYVVYNIADLSGSVTGNAVEARVNSGNEEALALGGGLIIGSGLSTLTGGDYTGNKAIAAGSNARAQGGAIFVRTDYPSEGLILDPTRADITFRSNTVEVNGVESANAIHFGRIFLTDSSIDDANLTIQDSTSTGNLITIADGITTDINNGKTFTISQTGGAFLWGGPNLFDSAGGDTVNLTGGTTRLMNGFSLNRGSTNGGTGLLPFNVTGGHLKSEGAATSLSNTALSVSGGKLTVDLGSTLTLDTASTFSLNNGVLSFGVGAGNASGLIDMTASTTAPTFNGSNTLDIADWIHGAYTVLKAGTAMDSNTAATFTSFTVGGNAINPSMSLSAALDNNGQDLQITASLARNNAEVAWGGVSGTWNYTDQNWTLGGSASWFLPGDAALFDSVTAQKIAVGGDSISLSGMKVTGGADYAFTGGALYIDPAAAQNLNDPGYAGNLVMEGTGTLLLATGGTANPNIISGDVLVSGGTLALADGFALEHTGAGGLFSVDATANTPILDVRGTVTINNMNLQLINGASELRFTAANSALTLNNASVSYLGAGVMDVDLNRSKTLAAVTISGGGTLSLDQSTLRMRHTGLVSDSGTWLLVDGAYTGTFSAVDIATATLTGTVNYNTGNNQLLFDGTYTVAGGTFPGYSSLSPNARRAWSGFRDAFYNQRTPFMKALDLAYGSPAEFQADLPRILNESHAEGAVSQGLHAMTAHNAAVGTALGYAFPHSASASSQNFAPLAFQASFSGQRHSFDMLGNGKSRREQAAATARYSDRLSSLDGDTGYMPQSYSVLANWQPASDMTRTLVASASPEYTLHAAGANSPYGVRFWGGYFGDFAHQDKKGGYAGYDADHNGFLLGGSFDLSSNWTAGVWAGWTSGETRYSGIKTRIETDATYVGAFARYKREAGPGTLKVTGDVAYSYAGNDSRRTVPTALGDQRMKGSFDQDIWGGGLEVSYDWSPQGDPATVLTPFLSARYSHLEQDGFTESGNLALKVGKTDADSFSTSLGITAARDFSVSDTVIVTPKATIGWRRQWADDTVSTRSSFVGSPVTFMNRSVRQDKDAAIVGAGVDVLIKTGQSWDMGLKVGYGADLSKNANDQNVFVGFEFKF